MLSTIICLFIIVFDISLVLFEWQVCIGRNNQGLEKERTQKVYAEIQSSSNQENSMDCRIDEKTEEETEYLVKLNVHVVKVNV